MKTILVFLAASLLSFFWGWSGLRRKNLANSEVYYLSMTSLPFRIGIPFVPEDRINEEAIQNHPLYFKAVYDSKGRLIELWKYLDGDIDFIQKINYQTKTVQMINSDGSIRQELEGLESEL